jgi:glucose/arabinose dehydrogenase
MKLAFPNMTFPFITELVSADDGSNHLFLLTQRGIIYVFPDTSETSNPKVFLDLTDSVSQTGAETGLLGIAFHPGYSGNGYFYVDYTTSQLPLRSKISRFTVSPSNPDSAIRNSELVILTLGQPFENHNGGKLLFGPDNYLYISLGDGGSGGDPNNNAQNRTVLLGKILRVNIDSSAGGNNYSIPVTNPFYGNPNGWRQEIFAWGLRNTWKFCFDLPAGRMWAADVGESSWEEIDIIQSGKNYGWHIMEGFECFDPPTGCDTAGLTLPIWSYGRSEGDAITGGYVYRGHSFPSLTGKYIYGDFEDGKIWALTYDGTNPPKNELLFDTPYFISTFGTDSSGEIFICTYGPSGQVFSLSTGPFGGGGEEYPAKFILKQNYPNPFNASTTIKYGVPGENPITIKIYDILGREILTLVNAKKSPGYYSVIWDASNYSSGIYFYSLISGSTYLYKKMVLVK